VSEVASVIGRTVSLVFNSKKTRLRGFFFVVKIFQFGALKVFQ